MICQRCKKKSRNVLFCEFCGERRYKAKLRIVDRLGEDHALYLFPRDYLIGRDTSADILLNDSSVSRRHAKLHYDNGRFILKDLNSKNGVLVGLQKCQEHVLKNYDYFQIGPYVLHFYYPDANFPEERIHTHTGEFIQQTLLKISRDIQNKNMLDDVLNTIMDAVMSVTNAREGILILPETTDDLGLKITRNLKTMGTMEQIHPGAQAILTQVQKEGRNLLIDDKGNKIYFDELEKLPGQFIRLIGLPLISRKVMVGRRTVSKVMGAMLLRLNEDSGPFPEKAGMLLESLRNQAIVAIENSYLYGEALAKRKIDNELEIARSIQSRLLPREITPLPMTDLAAISQPCHYVGGDYYDVIPIQQPRVALTIADISGKGIGAALMMSSLQGSLRAQINYECKPEQIVNHLNQLIRESSLESLYATFFFAVYNYENGTLSYVNAGHNPPMLFRRNGDVDLLKSSATALGILENNRGKEEDIQLAPGDILVCYTDGLTEAMDTKMQQFGIEPIKNIICEKMRQQPELSANALLHDIMTAVKQHTGSNPLHDDLTILILKRKLPAGS